MILALLVAPLSIVDCKDDANLGGARVTVTPDFLAESAMPDPASVSFQKGAVTGGRIFIDVVVTDVTVPVSGITLKLTYPNAVTEFVDCVDGDLFLSGDCFFSEPGSRSGEVFIGRSVVNPEPAIPVNGSQVIVRIEFLVFAAGNGDIIIEAQNLGGSDASALLDEDGDPILVQWSAGEILGM